MSIESSQSKPLIEQLSLKLDGLTGRPVLRMDGGDVLGARPLLVRGHVDQFSGTQVRAIFDGLPKSEQERAVRYRREVDFRSFVCARWILREVLARLLDKHADRIELGLSMYGKPYLMHEVGSIEFNLSHSQGAIALVLSQTRPVGVDLEGYERRFDAMELARRFFHPGEVVTLENLSESALDEGFTRLWVVKEAVIKAMGKGLSQPLDGFMVPSEIFLGGNQGTIEVGNEGLEIIPLRDEGGMASAVAVCLLNGTKVNQVN